MACFVLLSAISSDWRARMSFFQHWLYHLTDWVHHLSRPDCHISLRCHHWRLSCHVGLLGERGTDVEMFAQEEGVIALSACCRRAHAEPSCSPPQSYLRWRPGFENTTSNADRCRRKPGFNFPKVFHYSHLQGCRGKFFMCTHHARFSKWDLHFFKGFYDT